MRRDTRPIVLITALSAAAAHAGVVVHSEARSLSAGVTINGQSDLPGSVFAPPGVLFDDQVSALLAVSGAAAGASATQISDFLSDRISAQGSTSTSAGSSSGASIQTAASSVFEIIFSVDTATEVQIVSSRSGQGAVSFGELNGPDLFTGSGVQSFTLAAGTMYRFAASAAVGLDAPGSQGGSYAVQLLGVPAPSAAAPLALAGLLATRRRR